MNEKNTEMMENDAFAEGFGTYEATAEQDDFDAIFDDEAIAAGEQAPDSGEAEFTLKHLGEEIAVTRDKAIELAQKGMDYDRIRQRYERMKTTALESGGDAAAIKRTEDIDEFLEDFPDIKPETIPAEVWQQVRGGRGLADSYRRWENARLREEADARVRNQRHAATSTGSRSFSSGGAEADEFTRILLEG